MLPWSHFLGDLRNKREDWSKESRDAFVRIVTVKSKTTPVTSQDILVAEINSCRFVEKDTKDVHRGRISPVAIAELERQIKKLDPNVVDSCIKIASVHHHPILIPDLAEPKRNYDAIIEAASLLRALRRHGFHLLLHGHKHTPFTFTEDSLSARQKNRHAYPLMVACGGSASSSALLQQFPFNCYNRILFKWLPDAQQYRCQVETRILVNKDDNDEDLVATNWTWRELSRDDRSFRKVVPVAESDAGKWRKFNINVDDDSARKGEYALSRDILPVVAVRPSLTPGQAHEAVVELRRHSPRDRPPPPTPPIPIQSVRWSACGADTKQASARTRGSGGTMTVSAAFRRTSGAS